MTLIFCMYIFPTRKVAVYVSTQVYKPSYVKMFHLDLHCKREHGSPQCLKKKKFISLRPSSFVSVM